MPFNRRNKRKSIVIPVNLRNKNKIAIKTRLIEISMRVDEYIYKNKPIAVEEAEKYVHEISVHRTQCYNDTHILQVIEKLVRCLKTIIEETKNEMKKLLPIQNKSPTKNGESMDYFLEFSVNNKHEDRNITNNHYNPGVIIETINNNKGQKLDTEVIIVISNSENEEKDKNNKARSPAPNQDNNYVCMEDSSNFNVIEKNYKLKSCNLNNHSLNPNTINVDSTGNLVTQHELIKTLISQPNNVENKKQLKLYDHNIDHKPKQITNDDNILILEKNRKTRKHKKKITKSIDNTRQIFILSNTCTKARITEKKNMKSVGPVKGITQKSLTRPQTYDSEATTINTNTSKKVKITSKKTKRRVPKNNPLKNLPDPTNKRKKSTNNNSNTLQSDFKQHNNPSPSYVAPGRITPNKYQHTYIDVIGNELSLPVPKINNRDARNIVINQNTIAKQTDNLKTYNECVLNDLSWIEGIRYVREIGTDEFYNTPNINENFWQTFSLPVGWNEIDFVD